MAYGIRIRCTESQAQPLAEEFSKEGYSTHHVFDISKPYPGEKPSPSHWLRATVVVRGFPDQEAVAKFVFSNRLVLWGRTPFVYQFKAR